MNNTTPEKDTTNGDAGQDRVAPNIVTGDPVAVILHMLRNAGAPPALVAEPRFEAGIRGAISCHTARQKMELIVHRALLAVALRAVMKEAGPGISPGTRLRAARALAAASAPEAQG